MSGVCAIHQPNFFPWLGYFDKIRRADVFVLLDAVDYPRAGSGGMGSWTNRVKLLVGGEPRWVGCPVRRLRLGDRIADAQIDDGQPWRSKLLKTLQANYGRAGNYAQAMDLLGPLVEAPGDNLAAFNIAAIDAIAGRLGAGAQRVRQSELSHDGHGTDLLISLTRAAGCATYLAGGGAGGYQDDNAFAHAGITLRYQNFAPAPYGSPAVFTPGLSVIDYLMHDGRPLAEAFPDGR